MEISFSLFTTFIIAFFFLFYYSYYYLIRSTKTNSYSKPPPPEAGGARLITGHLHLMSGGSSTELLPHIRLGALADQHGPIFTIRLGLRRALVVSSPELIKELFTAGDLNISSRPITKVSKHLSRNFAMFGSSPYGAHWRQMRRLVSGELLSARRVEMQRDVRVSETAASVGELYKLWEAEKRLVVDMKKWFGDLNLNVILRVVAGKRFDGDAEETKRCRRVMRDFFHLSGVFVMGYEARGLQIFCRFRFGDVPGMGTIRGRRGIVPAAILKIRDG